MSRLVRPSQVPILHRIKIALGVAALGAFAGGIAGGISAAVIAAIVAHETRILLDWSPYLFGAEFGAPLGAILFPLAAWTLMRRVSFGRAAFGTIAGAFIGGFAGYFITSTANALWFSIAGGVLGVALAATWMWMRSRAKAEFRESVV